MQIDMRKWVEELISNKSHRAIPVLTHLGIEMTGHTVHEAVTDAEVHAAAVMELAKRYPSAASTMIMDLTVEAEAFGAHIDFSENDVPNVTGRLICSKEDVDALEVPSLGMGRVPIFLEANRIIASNNTKPVISGCIGPFSLAGRLYDMTETMMGIILEPDTIHSLLEKCTAFIESYCLALKNAGSNGVMIAEPAAGLLSNDQCAEFSSAYVKRIIEKVQDDNFAVILHNCGNMGNTTGAMVSVGAAGYHFGNGIDMLTAIKACPADTLAMGNLDPVSLFKQAYSDTMYIKTMELLKLCGSYPNFIISSGCDVPPGIPAKNVDAFYKAIEDYDRELQTR